MEACIAMSARRKNVSEEITDCTCVSDVPNVMISSSTADIAFDSDPNSCAAAGILTHPTGGVVQRSGRDTNISARYLPKYSCILKPVTCIPDMGFLAIPF